LEPEVALKERRTPLTQPVQPPAHTTERAVKSSTAAKPTVGRIESRIQTKTLTPRPGAESKVKAEARIQETRTQPVEGARILKPLYKTPPVVEPPKPELEPPKPPAKPQFKEKAKDDPAPARERERPIKSAAKFSETQIIEIPYIVVSGMSDPYPGAASLWVRTLAGGCDFEIIAMAYLPIFAAYATLNTSLGNEALFILMVLLAATTFVYQAVTLNISDRTFGMALLNMRLVNTDDESLAITRRQMLLRAWAATIEFICPPINFIFMRLNKKRLSLPDLVSGTSPIEE
jgi:uncharacterized RDD family membrane protein YckC